MIALVWAALRIAAAEPTAWTALPTERLAAIGLGSPTISEEVPGLARYPLATGGVVSLFLMPSVAEADRVFDRTVESGATMWSTAPDLPGERAIGDGRSVVLLRDRNAVVWVRALDGHAGAVAERVLGALR
jgi:hypothetical protein